MKPFRQPSRPRKSSLIPGAARILDALREGKPLDRIYILNRLEGQEVDQVKALARNHGVPVNYVPAAKLQSFNLEGHDGFIAQIARVQYFQLQDIIDQVIGRGEAPLLLILDGITDIRNIGGIARTAFCCGVHGIIIPDKGVGALNEDALLTSAGALEKIPFCRVNSLMKAVDELHLNGIRVLAAEMEEAIAIDECDFRVPVAIVMGSEEKGIYPALLKICDERIRIPMRGDFESLNVSVATGMILYEAMKQRMKGQ